MVRKLRLVHCRSMDAGPPEYTNPSLVYPPMPPTPASPSVRWIDIGPDADGQRIDNYLLRIFRGLPKARIYSMLRSGEVRVDGGRVKPEHRLSVGERLRLPPVRLPTPTQLAEGEAASRRAKAESARQSITTLHDTDGLWIVDKPAGLAVHGGSGIELGLVEVLRQAEGEGFLELVHRLDRDTSGLLMLARSRPMLLKLHEALRNGNMRKRYLALVWGDAMARLGKGSHPVDAPLLKTRLPNGERWVRVDVEGQASITRVRCLGVSSLDAADGSAATPVSLVQAEPLTGRTHQIRVHLKHLGLPIVGDPKYGREDLDKRYKSQGIGRMFLHAWRLQLPISPKALEVEAAPAGDFHAMLRSLDLARLVSTNTPVSP